ncbi:hypothetical protein H0A70_05240 [Alcaligenaceae bacterium]|nr:hypothetical protein [Alcaligenaceae bacterium]
MTRKIKVHYYAVSPNHPRISFDSVLTQLSALSLSHRERVVGPGAVRLEIVDRHGSDWFMHITAARVSNWPGVAQSGQPSSDLQIGVRADLTENTFAAFDTTTGRLVLQFTQGAVRAGRLFAYFDQVTGRPNSFLYTPVLNSDALKRYANKHAFTEVEAVIDNVTSADIAYFSGSPLTSAVRQSVQAGVERLVVGFKVDARVATQKINKGFVDSLVQKVMSRGSRSDKLVVKGRDAADGPVEAIDLLADVKMEVYDEKAVTLTPGRRYRPDDMRRILFDALRK